MFYGLFTVGVLIVDHRRPIQVLIGGVQMIHGNARRICTNDGCHGTGSGIIFLEDRTLCLKRNN